jgi:ADP-ribose pyrophosphatase YjhB (NUDIX family)
VDIKKYEKEIGDPKQKVTLLLLRKNDEVLLAMKKRGFGVGRWNGTGGKVQENETVEEAAIRETQEEINVTPKNLKKVAVFNFYSPNDNKEKEWAQQAHVFISYEWDGSPTETEEMKPKWFRISEIPYEEMWVDDEIWMPKVFESKTIKGCFAFGGNDSLIDYYLEEVPKF